MDALGMHDLDADVQKNLRVARLFNGRQVPIVFDPANKDILGLTLMPGDEILSRPTFAQMPELEALTNRLSAALGGEQAKSVIIADFSEESGGVTLQEVLLADRLWISLLNQQRGFTLNRDVLRKQLDKGTPLQQRLCRKKRNRCCPSRRSRYPNYRQGRAEGEGISRHCHGVGDFDTRTNRRAGVARTAHRVFGCLGEAIDSGVVVLLSIWPRWSERRLLCLLPESAIHRHRSQAQNRGQSLDDGSD